jgi:predicted NAD/FAD-binding protein
VTSLTTDPLRPNVVQLATVNDHSALYHHVILACHSDAALAILKTGNGMTENEEIILSHFRWSKNKAVLHSDTQVRGSQYAFSNCSLTQLTADAPKQTSVVLLELSDFFNHRFTGHT